MIEFRHVGKVYPDGTIAVDDLSFVAPAGHITALVGPSGCGKTTSLRMINRLVDTTSGAVLVDGANVDNINLYQLRRSIGYVIQNAGLFPHRTVVDNIATVPMLLGEKRRKARMRAYEMMEMVGLDADYASRYPWQLSGGQQQRVGIARALAADPPYLLMDEPFSALDPIVRVQLQAQMRQIQEQVAKTIVIVTHNVEEALHLGDQVVVLRQGGKLAQIGSPEELVLAPASQFVADFLGGSRGYQSLSLAQNPVPLTQAATIVEGETVPADGPRWRVVLSREGRPLGWSEASPGQVVTSELVSWSSTPIPVSANLRDYLDAVLSSPNGHGIAVDTSGVVAGTFSLAEVMDVVQSHNRQGVGSLGV